MKEAKTSEPKGEWQKRTFLLFPLNRHGSHPSYTTATWQKHIFRNREIKRDEQIEVMGINASPGKNDNTQPPVEAILAIAKLNRKAVRKNDGVIQKAEAPGKELYAGSDRGWVFHRL